MEVNKENNEIKWCCRDCKKLYPPIFMIKHDLWRKMVNNKKDIICWDCFEKLLGRNISVDDLLVCPANEIILKLLKKYQK